MGLLQDLRTLADWSRRRWLAAVAAAVVFTIVVGMPTDLIPNPLFGREIPPTWWSWPALLVSSALAGLLVATYVNPLVVDAPTERRGGYAGGLLTFFAVGCPVCNKLVLLALGSTGAITWFEPVQPALQLLGVALLTYALLRRLRGERLCPALPAPTSPDAERTSVVQ